jgi:hypothetical protein
MRANPLSALIETIKIELRATPIKPTRIRISKAVANSLASMTADVWHAAGKGFIPMSRCEVLVSEFNRGAAAVNGLQLSMVSSAVLELSENEEAPEVEILE